MEEKEILARKIRAVHQRNKARDVYDLWYLLTVNAYRMADLYVMPSVSEPFGITPLEAVMNKIPALVSKQSGVIEVLKMQDLSPVPAL